MPRKRRAEEYENEEGSPAVRNKKVKKKDTSGGSTKTKKKNGDGDGDGGGAAAGSSKGKSKSDNNNKKKKKNSEGEKKTVPGDGGKDSKGEEFWELSGKRRVTVSLYAGKHMINIREYYEKDGDFLPGKKGISLTMEQFNNLVSALPHLETVLSEKGETIPRPEYGAAVAKKSEAEDEEEEEARDTGEEEEEGEEEVEEDEEEEKQGKPTKKEKKNFEETSDEE